MYKCAYTRNCMFMYRYVCRYGVVPNRYKTKMHSLGAREGKILTSLT